MKKLIALLFVIIGLTGFAQEKTNAGTNSTGVQKRTNTSSVKAETSPLPYDVNDKYMGRSAEFLNNLTVNSLPTDFPLYDKKMTLSDYNQTVDAYYRSHTSILKEAVKQKLTQK